MTTNLNIKFYGKAYVNFQNYNESLPLGQLTHYEEKAPATSKKRMEQCDSRSSKDSEGVIFDNVPMVGFRISRSQRRLGWNNRSEVIQIEDPRGFEVQITIANLIMLTDNNLLENGEILRECIWGRDGNNNVLLPVNSEPYKQALENLDRIASSVRPKSVEVGNEVLLKNGNIGRYMGTLWSVGWHSVDGERSRHSSRQTISMLQVGEKKHHFIAQIEPGNGYTRFEGTTSPGISKELKSSPMDLKDVNDLIFDKFHQKNISYNHPGSSYNAIMATTGIPVLKDLIKKEIVLDDFLTTDDEVKRYDYLYATLKANPNLCFRIDKSYFTRNYYSPVYTVGGPPVSLNAYPVEINYETRTVSITYNGTSVMSNELDYFVIDAEIFIPDTNQNFIAAS